MQCVVQKQHEDLTIMDQQKLLLAMIECEDQRLKSPTCGLKTALFVGSVPIGVQPIHHKDLFCFL